MATSVVLIGWLLWRISPRALANAASELEWKLLVPATIVMVLSLYLWDPLCFPIVYRISGHRWNYWQSLHLRGLSYVGGALHYEIGRAAVALGFARMQQTRVARMLSRGVVSVYHDILVLLTMGLVGAVATHDDRLARIRTAILVALSILIAIGALCWAFAGKLQFRFGGNASQPWFHDWTIRRSLQLIPLRTSYFAILVLYAAVALRICELPVDHHVVVSSIPLVLLADGLPTLSGLGTRETALQLLIKTARPDRLLAMSLIWSSGLIIVRSVIGLVHLWIDRFLKNPFIDSSRHD